MYVDDGSPRKPREPVKVAITFVVLLLGLAMIAWPFLWDDGWAQGGGASLLIGSVVFVFGLLLFLFYRGRARVERHPLKGENVLAHWHYDPLTWEQISQKEVADLGMIKVASGILGGLFALIGLIFVFVDPKKIFPCF